MGGALQDTGIQFPSSLENVHGRFLIALALRRQVKLPIEENYLKILGNHLYRSALLEQELARDVPLSHSREFPGYLRGTVNGTQVLVPWHLVEVFPGYDLLNEIESLACTRFG